MRQSMWRVLSLAVVLAACASMCAADSIWDYEAVNPDGTGSHPLVGGSTRITIEGIALAGVNELWNNTMYTVFVQDDTSIKGGMQAWAGSWWYDPWRPADYPDFQAGDRVRIVGLLANNAGKVFINDRHSGAPATRFTVTVLGHPGLPDPELLSSVSNCNYFDQTRVDGGERYQTRLVMLHGLHISAGTWANNSQLAVYDPTGSVDMWLASMGNFTGTSAPAGKFNVVGIMDQEDASSPFTGDYRLLVKKYEDVALALDACRQVRDHNGERVALINKVVSRVYDGFFCVQDPDRAGGVKVVSSRSVVPGDVVCVQGLVSTVDGEYAVTPTYLSLSKNDPKPLFVNSNGLWGTTGLDVDGLLVRCVATVGTDQGSGIHSLTDDGGKTIYIKTNGVTMPAQGSHVAITAVATRDGSGTPILLPASWHDVQVVN